MTLPRDDQQLQESSMDQKEKRDPRRCPRCEMKYPLWPFKHICSGSPLRVLAPAERFCPECRRDRADWGQAETMCDECDEFWRERIAEDWDQ